MKKLYGVTVAMVTPIDDNGNVMYHAVRDLVDFLVDKGAHCLYPLGTTGEMLLLSVEERKKVAKTVVDYAKDKATVFIHVGAMTQNDTVELAKHAREIGADGIGVVTPSYFSLTDREIEEYYVSVAKSVPENFPVYLYNIPQCSNNDIKPSVIKNIIKRCPNVIGIKYSLSDMLRTAEYLKINDGNFSVVQGTDRLFLPALAMGCDGTVSGISSVFPEHFVAVYEAFKEGNLEKARKCQNIGTEIAEILKNGSNMAYFKAGLKLRGINVGHMRRPLLDLTGEQIKQLEQSLKEYL